MSQLPLHVSQIRRATAADWPSIVDLDGQSFGTHLSDERIALTRKMIPDDNVLLAFSGDHLVGVTMHYDLQLTVPGGALIDLPGVSWVSVAATHRRRGVLRALLAEQHAEFLRSGAPLAVLTASEGGIYGRFGYGPATTEYTTRIDRRFAEFRESAPNPEGVRYAAVAEARAKVPAIYDRWRRLHPGALRRPEAYWENIFADRADERDGASPLFFLLHTDGYVSYRFHWKDEGGSAEVTDFFAATDEAHAALWRVVCALDLAGTVTSKTTIDDPIAFLLKDSRLPKVVGAQDLLWVRILDVPVALAARGYATDLDVVIEVSDDFLGRGGVFHLRAEGGTATCEPTEETPQVRLDIADLGSLYLGGHRARTLAAAGQLWSASDEVLRAVDIAFSTARAPLAGMFF